MKIIIVSCYRMQNSAIILIKDYYVNNNNNQNLNYNHNHNHNQNHNQNHNHNNASSNDINC